MKLELAGGAVRSWRLDDADSLVRHADDRAVWLQLRDLFPHPYTPRHARRFLDEVVRLDPELAFAIEVEGEAAGGIGISPGRDVERVSAEVGYWLGRAHWGRGIMTEAVRAFTPWAIERFELTRVFALPYARNRASVRVLEKAGYELEGRMRKSAIKDGEILDQLLYAYVAEERGDAPGAQTGTERAGADARSADRASATRS